MARIRDRTENFKDVVRHAAVYDETGLLGLSWNVAGYMAGIRVLLEDGGLLGMGWSVAGYVAVKVLPLEDGIGAGSLAVGIFPLIFASFVG
ncbi:hypothetical protein AB3S75_012396 [Citrus x aurantiifolia]